MKLFYVKNFNNYTDRIIKHAPHEFNALYSFIFSNYSAVIRDDVNFDMADGVDTTVVVNWDENWTPNYLFATGDESSEYNPITSWFVMEFKKLRGRQYRLTLHRDVINDFYDEVINSPCFIQKASLNASNDLIFNSEGMKFNQIKQSEELLKDKFGSYYYVAYVANPIPDGPSRQIVIPNEDFEFETISNPNQFFYGAQINADSCVPFHRSTDFYVSFTSGTSVWTLHFANGIVSYERDSVQQGAGDLFNSYNGNYDDLLKELCNILTNDYAGNGRGYIYANIATYFSEGIAYATDNEFTQVQNIIGKNVHDNWAYSGQTSDEYFKYDRLYTIQSNLMTQSRRLSSSNNLTAYIKQKIQLAASNLGKTITINSNGSTSLQVRNVNKYQLLRTRITDTEAMTITLPGDKHTADAPYDIIVIPDHMDLALGTSVYNQTISRISNSYQEAFVKALTEKGTSEKWLYDIQRLPYSYFSTDNVHRTVYNACLAGHIKKYAYYNTTSAEGNPTSATKVFFLYSPTKQITFNIQKSIQVVDTKIENECDMYRIVSPNGQGAFEFNLAKNDGMEYINIDCTLRPVSPYIHANPNFKRLYKADYNDYKGLICGGDFSIATVSDRWLEYAAQNKYLSQTFDREIQNFDFNARLAMIEQGIGGTVGAIGSGLSAGMMTGNVYAGLAVGAMSGAAAGGDAAILNKKLAEQRDLKTDLFNFSLRNVQAQPKTLVKTGSDDYNNKIWITLEYYSCTDIEKEALKEKLKYNGMTVMVIGKIADYIQPEQSYIQGQIIRLDTISEDAHLLSVIMSEIAQGVYL